GGGAADFDEIAVLARDVMNLLHARDAGQLNAEVFAPGRLVGLDEDEGQQSALDLSRIEAGRVTLNDASAFELADALEHRRRRHSEGPPELSVGDPRVSLQQVQNLKVPIVQHPGILGRHRRFVNGSQYIQAKRLNIELSIDVSPISRFPLGSRNADRRGPARGRSYPP